MQCRFFSTPDMVGAASIGYVAHPLRAVLADSNPAGLSRDDATLLQLLGVTGHDLRADSALSGGSEIHDADDSTMRGIAHHSEFSEVFIQRHQNAAFLARSGENKGVTGVFGPLASPGHLMPGDLQFGFGLWADAGVQKNPQELISMESGSIRSLAAMRRA